MTVRIITSQVCHILLAVASMIATGCGGAADTGEGWSFAGDDGTRPTSSDLEADEILFMRRRGEQALGTTRLEGADVEFGNRYNERTFQWPEGVEPVPVEGLGDIEGRTLMRTSGIYDIESQLSVGVVSGRVRSTADGLEIRSPEFQLCRTARLLDYTIVPREGDRCAHVDRKPIQIKSRELFAKTTTETTENGRQRKMGSAHLAVTLGDASRWSACSIDLLDEKPGIPSNTVQRDFRRFLSTFGAGKGAYTKTSIDCRGASSPAKLKRRESWISGTLSNGELIQIAGIHLQMTLEGRELALWFRVDPSIEVTDPPSLNGE